MWRVAAVLVVVVGALLVTVELMAGRRSQRTLEAVLVELDSVKLARRRVDSIYVVDTVRLWSAVRSLDTLTVTVAEWKHDTTRVVEYVERAAETVAACTTALLTCEARVAARDAELRLVRDSAAAVDPRRWAVGLVYDGRAGVSVARDLTRRWRAGVDLVPDRRDSRAALRVLWTW